MRKYNYYDFVDTVIGAGIIAGIKAIFTKNAKGFICMGIIFLLHFYY